MTITVGLPDNIIYKSLSPAICAGLFLYSCRHISPKLYNKNGAEFRLFFQNHIDLLRKNGAAYRIRTYDPFITNEVLYQLS